MTAPDDWMPWLDPLWDRWIARLGEDRLPHAVLLEGPAGTGKRMFAERLARAFLCTGGDADKPCDACSACRWTRAGTHPDFHRLSPEEGREIAVEQVRSLIARLMLSGHSSRRVSIVDPAQAFNRSSANAFLKTLEEPPPDVLMLLVAEQSARLPATILSRCQREGFSYPSREEATAWLAEQSDAEPAERDTALELAGGSAGEAQRMLSEDALGERRSLIDDLAALADGRDDPVSVAERWQKRDVSASLGWMARWLAQHVRDARREGSGASPLQPILSRVDLFRVFELYDQVNAAQAELETQLRTDLLLETLLVKWCRMTGGREEAVT